MDNLIDVDWVAKLKEKITETLKVILQNFDSQQTIIAPPSTDETQKKRPITSLDNEFVNTASSGDIERMRLLLDMGANIHSKDSNGNNALFHAVGVVSKVGLDMVKFLVDNGADVNDKCNNGSTPLIHAVEMEQKEQIETVRFLVNKGAFLNIKTTDYFASSALISAAESNQKEIVRILLENKANPNIYNYSDKTILDFDICKDDSIRKLIKAAGGTR